MFCAVSGCVFWGFSLRTSGSRPNLPLGFEGFRICLGLWGGVKNLTSYTLFPFPPPFSSWEVERVS